MSGPKTGDVPVVILRALRASIPLFIALAIPSGVYAAPRGMRRPFSQQRSALRTAAPDAVVHTACSVRRNALAYHGGALVHDPDVFLLFWGAQWNSDAAHVAAKNSLISMFQAIGTSEFACAWREYGVNGEPLGPGTYNGAYVIPGAPPNPLDDSVIQSRIVAEVAAGHAPSRTDDRIYVVVTPNGVPVNAGGDTGCGGSNFRFCGYHDAFVSGGAFRYAVLPYPCTIPGQGTCFVSGAEDVATAFQAVGAHELTEIVTDPDSNPGGWFSDRTGDENADICASDQCVDTVTNGSVTFTVNPAWSNMAKGCITSVPCPPQPIGCTDPSPGACVPGTRPPTSCAAEFLVDPNLTLKKSSGLPTGTLTCTDGQTLCDFDSVAGQCTFHVAACLNSQDPRLPLCTPSSIQSVTVKKPSLGDPITATLQTALKNVSGASTGSVSGASVSYAPAIADPNVCTGYMSITVPAGAKRRIGLLVNTGSGAAKNDLRLSCHP